MTGVVYLDPAYGFRSNSALFCVGNTLTAAPSATNPGSWFAVNINLDHPCSICQFCSQASFCHYTLMSAVTLTLVHSPRLPRICVLSILFRKIPPQSNYKSSTVAAYSYLLLTSQVSGKHKVVSHLSRMPPPEKRLLNAPTYCLLMLPKWQ